MVAAYMRQHNTSIPAAVAALSAQMHEMMAGAVHAYGQRHGLGQDDTWAALLTHGTDGPRCLQ